MQYTGFIKKAGALLTLPKSSNNQKEFDKIAHFLFGVGVPNPDQSGCWRHEKGPSLTRRKKDP